MESGEAAFNAINHISDWSKWLVTLETFAIGIVGSIFTKDRAAVGLFGRLFGSLSILCFGASICFASLLLLTMPEIIQTLDTNQSVWSTQDSIVGETVGWNTTHLVVIQSLLFAIGVVLGAFTILTVIWGRKS